MDARLARAQATPPGARTLYISPSGVAAGSGTFVHHLIAAAGLDNFDDRSGWRPIPLERLAYETPDVYAVGAFGAIEHNVAWTAFRHPVAVRRVQAGPAVSIDGAATSCGGWFLADAVEALAAGAAASGTGPTFLTLGRLPCAGAPHGEASPAGGPARRNAGPDRRPPGGLGRSGMILHFTVRGQVLGKSVRCRRCPRNCEQVRNPHDSHCPLRTGRRGE